MGKKSCKPLSPEQILVRNAERRAAEREADRRMEWGVSTDTLVAAERHGHKITEFPARPGEREKPPKRLSGLDWLWSKSRITVTQMGAGLKYGDTYRRANDISIRSGSNYFITGGDGTTAQQTRMEAQDEIEAVRRNALRAHPGMITLCDDVCGDGRRLRELASDDERLAAKKEGELKVALDLLARHYGMIAT